MMVSSEHKIWVLYQAVIAYSTGLTHWHWYQLWFIVNWHFGNILTWNLYQNKPSHTNKYSTFCLITHEFVLIVTKMWHRWWKEAFIILWHRILLSEQKLRVLSLNLYACAETNGSGLSNFCRHKQKRMNLLVNIGSSLLWLLTMISYQSGTNYIIVV